MGDKNAPYTHGVLAFSAIQASKLDAEILGVPEHSALFAYDLFTWDNAKSVTKVQLLFAPGYELRKQL